MGSKKNVMPLFLCVTTRTVGQHFWRRKKNSFRANRINIISVIKLCSSSHLISGFVQLHRVMWAIKWYSKFWDQSLIFAFLWPPYLLQSRVLIFQIRFIMGGVLYNYFLRLWVCELITRNWDVVKINIIIHHIIMYIII